MTTPRPTMYDRPVEAKLVVRLANGDEWEATSADMVKFGYVDRLDAYVAFADHVTDTLTKAGLIEGDLTDAKINPLRYLVELAINYPELLAHPDIADQDEQVVAIERALQSLPAHETDSTGTKGESK